MARADLLLTLVKAGSQGDNALFKKAVEALIAEERAKQHHVLADRLAESLQHNGNPVKKLPLPSNHKSDNLFFELTPQRTLSDLLLPETVQVACEELVEEQHRSDLLRSHNLEPRHLVLVAGPPGNGKTSLAEALASELMVPLLVVRYENIIGSYLGETAQRLKLLFDYVSTQHCVLFFDEFDAIGKERGDVHETGEIKRVVSSLLIQIDALPSYVVVVTASNHPELLDKAVWRRFQLRLHLPAPSPEMLTEWFHRFEKRMGLSLGYTPQMLADQLKRLSFAEVESFGADIQRRYILSQPNANLKQIVSARLKQWQARFTPSHNDNQSEYGR